MKTKAIKTAIFILSLIYMFPDFGFCQSKILGKWEGKFMNDFKTILEIDQSNNKGYVGKIIMFSGNDIIQNDPISNIRIEQNTVSFRIEAKETDFKGELNAKDTELKGVFIFPDQSEHPIHLTKNALESSAAEVEPKSFRELKHHKYSVEELQQDYHFLLDKIREYHPQLYSCISKKDFEILVRNTEAKINTEFTLSEFFILISPVVESIKCSHTGIRLPSDYESLNQQNGNYLPFEVFFDGQKFYYLKSIESCDTNLIPGDEIVSINQLPVSEIKNLLYSFIPVEGQNKSTKIYQINQNFNSIFNLIDDSNQFQIVTLRNGKIIKSTVQACALNKPGITKKEKNRIPLNFYIDKKINLGILEINSFMFGDINQYIQEMDGIFKTLQTENVNQLLIDLRGNQGGHPIFAAQLLSYLVDSDFVYFKRNEDVPDFEPLYNPMQASTIRFDGNVFVWLDGGCLSTSGHLISLIKYHTPAVFIGQKPGSTYRCNDLSIKKTLPNTKIEVNIPRTTFETAVADYFESHPFEVDFIIEYSIIDLLSGRDLYLDFLKSNLLQP